MKKLNVTQMENLQGGGRMLTPCEEKIARGAAMGLAGGIGAGIFAGPGFIGVMAGGYFGGMLGGLVSCLWD